jgi:hypothetical protein
MIDAQNIHCGESVTIEGQAYTVSAVTHRYQLRMGRYEPSEKQATRRPLYRQIHPQPLPPQPPGQVIAPPSLCKICTPNNIIN